MNSFSGVLVRICPKCIHKIYAECKYWIRFHFFPKGLANEFHKGIVGYDINWDNPTTINEKINWLKIFSDTSDWTRLADKYLVRDYVKERIGEKYLVKLYGVWQNADDIDFDSLPNKFVLKTNHGAGTILIVDDKSKLKVPDARRQLNQWLREKYGYKTFEPHYLKIKPLIIAEEKLDNTASFSSSIVDYKVFCFSGKPDSILTCSNRTIGGHTTNLNLFDLEWNRLDECLTSEYQNNIVVPKPARLAEMLACAEKLSESYPQMRVDFYEVDGRVYVGELTLSSQGGYMDYFTQKCLHEMGEKVTLPLLTKK